MKNIFKHKIFIASLLCVAFFGIGIKAATVYYSNEIAYTPSDDSWKVTNVEDALNSLYSINEELQTCKKNSERPKYYIKEGSFLGDFTLTGSINALTENNVFHFGRPIYSQSNNTTAFSGNVKGNELIDASQYGFMAIDWNFYNSKYTSLVVIDISVLNSSDTLIKKERIINGTYTSANTSKRTILDLTDVNEDICINFSMSITPKLYDLGSDQAYHYWGDGHIKISNAFLY